MDFAAESESQTFSVGPDCVIIQDGIVYLYARRPFPDWTIREFSRQAIYFRDGKFYLRLKEAAPKPYAVRYELAPWPADLHEQSKQSFVYDEAAVAARDRGARYAHGQEFVHRFLFLLYPLLGFCWSGTKERVLQPLGFVPVSITAASTALEFGLALLQGILFGYLGGGVFAQAQSAMALHPATFDPPSRLVDLGIFLVLLLDCVMRYSQVLRGDEVPDGFLEWLFRFRRKRRTPPE
ncbi:MAG: hypothetical protein HZA90_19120 [Verrucomicrobia bacterium]|nr:hypothetical protein [Verrucomicrobiota bacterium]